LNVSLPVNPAAVGGLAVDGTASVNQTNLSLITPAIGNWPPGAALWLVWQMPDSTGKAQGLAIDNLAFWASTQAILTPPPLILQNFGTNFVLGWPTTPGQTYQLQFTEDLASGAWLPWGAPLLGSGEPLYLTNTFAGASQRFFRLRQGP
jgi:hypothetical protein